MQRERQEEVEHEESMEENAGPLLISKLEVQRQYDGIFILKIIMMNFTLYFWIY